MKKLILIPVLFVIAAGYIFLFCSEKPPGPEKAIGQTLLAQVDSFTAFCTSLQSAAANAPVNERQLQRMFLQTRLAYKKFEWAAEYFLPATARSMNGPPVQEVEMSGQVFDPAGLQVLEGLLFPKYDTSKKKEFIRQLNMLQRANEKYKIYFSKIGIFDWQVFDAAKLEVFRITTLGITGFDDPLTLKSMTESAASLESLQKIIAHYIHITDTEHLMDKFEAANRYLAGNINFNSFDRAAFITTYCDSITTGLTSLENHLNIHVIRYNRLLNQDARTLSDTNAFNVDAYAPDQSSFITGKKIALGKKLFSDPVLSGSGTRSCRSCHQPEKAFTDGLVKNSLIGNSALLQRNTPTLINAALQPSQFYDLRVSTLEDQSLNVVQNPEEMHGSMNASVRELWKNETYRQMFAAAFPKNDRREIDTLEVMNALGSYVRSLVLLNSRFDEYMRGDKTALNAQEINGFNLFMGKARCATCHYMPLFNGTFPPRFVKMDAEVIGVPRSVSGNEIDVDMGRYAVIKIESFRHAFKTPTVRNAARTAPYMHNGVFATLEQVVDFYNKGGGAGAGLAVDNRTLSPDSLDLTEKEQNDIIAFIRSLDSRYK